MGNIVDKNSDVNCEIDISQVERTSFDAVCMKYILYVLQNLHDNFYTHDNSFIIELIRDLNHCMKGSVIIHTKAKKKSCLVVLQWPTLCLRPTQIFFFSLNSQPKHHKTYWEKTKKKIAEKSS